MEVDLAMLGLTGHRSWWSLVVRCLPHCSLGITADGLTLGEALYTGIRLVIVLNTTVAVVVVLLIAVWWLWW